MIMNIQRKLIMKGLVVLIIGFFSIIFSQTINFISPIFAMESEISSNPTGKENPSEEDIKEGLKHILNDEYTQDLYSVKSRNFLDLDSFINVLVDRFEDLGIKTQPEIISNALKSIEGNESLKDAFAKWSVTNQVRDRYTQIRAAAQDLLQTHLFTAAQFYWKDILDKHEETHIFKDDEENSKERVLKQHTISSDIIKKLYNKTFENYTIEVHYIKVKDSPEKYELIEVDKNKHTSNFSFKYIDPKQNTDGKIISLIVFKPVSSKDRKVPVAIFNHGGAATNFFLPTGKNPMLSAFAGLKYAIICPNYRGGSVKQHEEDMAAVIEYLKQLDYMDPAKIVLAGISAGTTLNAELLNKPIAKELAGVFLHTGLYQDRQNPNTIANNQSLLNVLRGIPRDLPIFLASGAKDPECNISSTLDYIHTLQGRSNNFSYFILDHGGHHLIEKVTDKVSEMTIADKTKIDLNALVKQIKNEFNTEEVELYAYRLVEFLDKIGYGEIKGTNTKADFIPKAFEPKGANIVQKARVSQVLKERNKKVFGPNILDRDKKLEQAALTPSLAHLKLLLGEKDYDPSNLDVTIERFLKKYDGEISAILAESAKDHPEDSLIQHENLATNDQVKQVILNILSTEESYKGSFPLYHASSSMVGFIYDIYSSMRRLLLIQGNIRRIRIVDDAFLKILSADDFISTMRKIKPLHPTTGFNYLPGYQDVGLSAQFFLFGGYKYWRSSTFFNFFLKNESIRPPSLENTMKDFFKAMGVENEIKLKEVVTKYTETYLAYIAPEKSTLSGGRLFQLFISPSIFNKMTYLSEVLGYPLELQLTDSSVAMTHEPLDVITLAITFPDKFKTLLIKNRKKFEHQNYKSRIDFFNSDENLLSCVEARVFMKPDYMDDPHKVQIIDYLAQKPNDAELKSYHKTLDSLVDETLAISLDLSTQPAPSIFHHEPALLRLKKYVDQGSKQYSLLTFLSQGDFASAEQYLKKYPQDVNMKIDANGHTLLYKFLENHNFEVAKFLIVQGANVNARNKNGQRLEEEFWHQHKFDAFVFLNHGIDMSGDINGEDEDGNTPLLLASQYGFLEIVQALLNKIKGSPDQDSLLNHQNKHGFTALHQAILGKHPQIALLLIEAFAKTDREDDEGYTPLMLAQTSRLPDVVKALEERALITAVGAENEEEALRLIEKGTNLLIKNRDGFSLLMVAAARGSVKIMEILIHKLADNPNLKQFLNYICTLDQESISALDIAIMYDFSEGASILIKAGADVSDQALKDMEEQHDIFSKAIAIYKGRLLLKALKDKDQDKAESLTIGGADLHDIDDEGFTSLMYASSLGYKDIFNTIMTKMKEEPDFINFINHGSKKNRGITALARALEHQHYDLAERLIQAGADLKIELDDGHQMMAALILVGQFKVAEWLIDHGAEINPVNRGGIPLSEELFGKGNWKGLAFFVDQLYQMGKIQSAYPDGNTPLLLASKGNIEPLVQELIDKEKDTPYYLQFLNQENRDGESALSLALANNHVAIAEILVKAGADLKLKGINGFPLLYALLFNHKFEAAKWLMNHGADKSATNSQGVSIADDLLKNKKMEAYIFLNHQIDLTDNDGDPLLILALKNDYYDVAMDLIKAGVDIHQTAEDGATALHYAIAGKQTEIALMLINAGADIHAKVRGELTPLMLASQKGSVDVVNALLTKIVQTKGPDALKQFINEYSKLGGGNSLCIALNERHPEIALILINAGADLGIKSIDGKTPLMLASGRGFQKVVDVMQEKLLLGAIRQKDQEQAVDLIRNGANFDAKDKDGNTPLMLATQQGLQMVVGFIQEKILFEAIRQKDQEQAVILIKKGANIDAKDKDGNTPLMLATQQGLQKVIDAIQEKLLLEAISQKDQEKAVDLIRNGANIDAKDETGNTSLMLASAAGLTTVVKEIKRNALLNVLQESEINLHRAEELLNQGDNLAVLIGMMNTALYDNNDDMVNKLLSQPKVNEVLLRTYSPLQIAVQLGSLDMVKTLLSKLGDQTLTENNIRNKDGNTPLHLAVRKRNPDMIKAMLSNPVLARLLTDDRYIKNREGKSVYEVIEEIRDKKVRDNLINAFSPEIWAKWERSSYKFPRF